MWERAFPWQKNDVSPVSWVSVEIGKTQLSATSSIDQNHVKRKKLEAYAYDCSPSGLQGCTHMVEVAKREQLPTTKERGEPSRDSRAL